MMSGSKYALCATVSRACMDGRDTVMCSALAERGAEASRACMTYVHVSFLKSFHDVN